MFPVLFEIGPLKINSYGVMIAAGFLTGLYFVQRDAVKRGLPPKVFADMAFILLPLGIAGTRIAHIIMFPEFYSWDDPIGVESSTSSSDVVFISTWNRSSAPVK